MTYHTQAYQTLTSLQQSAVECVIFSTSCTEQIAIDDLIAEEWDISNAVINILHAYPWAQQKPWQFN
jgi:hypothetical protein